MNGDSRKGYAVWQVQVIDFSIKIFQDEEFGNKMNSVVAGRTFDEALDDVVSFANDAGFEISAGELQNIGKRLGAMDGSEGDLSDDDLEDVAGGVIGFFKNLARDPLGTKSYEENRPMYGNAFTKRWWTGNPND